MLDPSDDDVLPIGDNPASDTATKKVTRGNLVKGLAAQTDLDAHTSDTTNPYPVTKAQVGLGNADNTADRDKPVSIAQQAALNGKVDTGTLVYNVTDHVATGDGVTDDTTAFASSTAAARDGGVVYVPAGVYVIDPATSLNLIADMTLRGMGTGSVIKIKNNANVLENVVKMEAQENVVLDNFAIDGNRSNQDLYLSMRPCPRRRRLIVAMFSAWACLSCQR